MGETKIREHNDAHFSPTFLSVLSTLQSGYFPSFEPLKILQTITSKEEKSPFDWSLTHDHIQAVAFVKGSEDGSFQSVKGKEKSV